MQLNVQQPLGLDINWFFLHEFIQILILNK